MALPQAVQHCIDRALKDELKIGDGRTNKQAVLLRTRMALRRQHLEPHVTQAAENAVLMSGIDRAMKRGLPDNVVMQAFRNSFPELVQKMKSLPKCIALGEGPEAQWVDSLRATPQDWRINAALKNKKANQTFTAAAVAIDIARHLEEQGLSCLGNSIDVDEEAA